MSSHWFHHTCVCVCFMCQFINEILEIFMLCIEVYNNWTTTIGKVKFLTFIILSKNKLLKSLIIIIFCQ